MDFVCIYMYVYISLCVFIFKIYPTCSRSCLLLFVALLFFYLFSFMQTNMSLFSHSFFRIKYCESNWIMIRVLLPYFSSKIRTIGIYFWGLLPQRLPQSSFSFPGKCTQVPTSIYMDSFGFMLVTIPLRHCMIRWKRAIMACVAVFTWRVLCELKSQHCYWLSELILSCTLELCPALTTSLV